MTYTTAEQVADKLQKLYDLGFGGKTRGRFKISKDELKALANRDALQGSFAEDIRLACYSRHSLLFIQKGQSFYGVLEESKLDGWRAVPRRLAKSKPFNDENFQQD